jgi:predicted anti-sigma-YlaC factor YlaD
MLATITAHWQAYALPAFTIASLILTAIEGAFVALGKVAPGWLGTAVSGVAKVLHFLNGNVPAAPAQTPPATPPAA